MKKRALCPLSGVHLTIKPKFTTFIKAPNSTCEFGAFYVVILINGRYNFKKLYQN